MNNKKKDNSLPEPPEYLSEKSKKLWRYHVGDRVISPGRIEAFRLALEALDTSDRARCILNEEGLTTVTKKSGVVHVHPLVKVERENKQLFFKIWNTLGLTWSQELDGGHRLY
jgi:phage terminase small subunit